MRSGAAADEEVAVALEQLAVDEPRVHLRVEHALRVPEQLVRAEAHRVDRADRRLVEVVDERRAAHVAAADRCDEADERGQQQLVLGEPRLQRRQRQLRVAQERLLELEDASTVRPRALLEPLGDAHGVRVVGAARWLVEQARDEIIERVVCLRDPQEAVEQLTLRRVDERQTRSEIEASLLAASDERAADVTEEGVEDVLDEHSAASVGRVERIPRAAPFARHTLLRVAPPLSAAKTLSAALGSREAAFDMLPLRGRQK